MSDDFDRSQFDVTLSLYGVRVPKQDVANLATRLRRCNALFDRPRLRSVVECDSDEVRLVLLREECGADLAGLPEDGRAVLRTLDIAPEPYELKLGYDYWPAEHVLRALLPPAIDVPTSFETVGHVAHLNLRDEALPFKQLIGRVLLDKNAGRIRTFLNKVGVIESEFRVPRFEVIAGDPCLETEVRQHGALFRLDYQKVYWNSRLEHEHKRFVDMLRPGEVLCDMMCGIGPFAIPAARKRIVVHANDLNPYCIRYLRENVTLNKVDDRVTSYNMDGRMFVRALAGASTATECGVAPSCFDHIVMNLPASAVEFLDAFAGAFSADMWQNRALPLVHCYAFLRDSETEADLKKRVQDALGGPIEDEWRMLVVRDVAPHKEMVCVSFRVPKWTRDDGRGKEKTNASKRIRI